MAAEIPSGGQVLKKNDVEPSDYREAMSRFAGAVHVITTDGANGRRGVTVIAACSVSDEPPMILAWLNQVKRHNDCFAANGVFTLNTLTARQQPLADAFSGLTGLSQEERFNLADWRMLSTGAPVLIDALASFDCEIVEAKDMATHRILFGRVTGLCINDSLDPLIYHHRRYRVL